MRLRTLGLAAVIAMGMAHPSSAFAPKRLGHERDFVTVGRDARLHQTTAWAAPASAHLGALAGWTVMWDRDTNVPMRLWGAGIAAPGAVADAAVAEQAARRFLADHLDLLAPGALVGDFVLVSNQLGAGNDLRTVGFEQRRNGLRVIGGTIGLGFKGDHLTIVSSTALPNVQTAEPAGRLSEAGIAANATTWLAGSGHAVRARSAGHASLAGVPGEIVILPIVHERGGRQVDVEYHTVESVVVETTAGKRGIWQVYLDATTGAPVARANRLESFTGTIDFDTTTQSPSQMRSAKPALFLTTVINGQTVTSDVNGVVTFTGANPASVQLSLAGPFVAVSDASQGLATDTLSLTANDLLTWSKSTVPFSDAELDAFIAANRAKEFVRERLDPTVPWLAQQMSVTVNDASDSCNAFSTGDDVHFFVSGALQLPDGSNGVCENTGRMADVVSHETGHSVHNNSVIQGQGAFPPLDGLSEGLADTLAVSITGDPGVGRGFFVGTGTTFANTPLRDLNPTTKKTWPVAGGEVHDEGEIVGETLWDLRQALQTKLGTEAGFTQLLKIFYTIMQRSPSIPASYVEALVADDDDGDLTNGTPNKCEIDAAFAAHNLSDPASALGLAAPERTGFAVTLALPKVTTTCPNAATVSAAEVVWHTGVGGTDATVPLAMGSGTFAGTIPTQPAGSTVFYQVNVTLSTGAVVHFPDNAADPYYEFYVGEVTNIYCTGFESGLESWTHSGTQDEWQAGTPIGVGGDPNAAHTGTGVVGIDLGSGPGNSIDGDYGARANESLVSPPIDLMGHTSVHLQYYRWLGVEDGEFDKASITANGQEVWRNKTTGTDPSGADEINHVDKEWVFEDVDLTAAIGSGATLQLAFDLVSDDGQNLAGWNIDDLCIVAVAPAPPLAGTCGDGAVGTGETCDDGNTVDGDGCSATCQTETPTMMGAGDGGCCSAGGNPAGPAALGLLTLGLVLRRRKRSAG